MIATRHLRPQIPRPARAALPLAAVLVGLTGCGTNFGAPTDEVYTPAQGVSNRDGKIDVLNAVVVSGEEGSGRLIAGLSNNDTETGSELVAVAPAEAEATVQFTVSGTAQIPAAGFVQLADDDAAFVAATGEGVTPSSYVRVTLSFSEGEDATLNVPVVTPGEYFADVSLTPPAG